MFTKKTTSLLLGSHLSIQGGLHKAIERAEEIGATAIQIWTKNGRTLKATPLLPEDIDNFKTTLKKSSITQMVVAHASYLINLASSDTHIAANSRAGLLVELERCEQLGIPYLVVHPGAHTGIGEEKGIENIAHNLDKVLEKLQGPTIIALETMAGQGTTLGNTFEQLNMMRNLTTFKNKIGFCFDTCHVNSAGYHLKTSEDFENVISEFDNIIGLNHLKVIHLNDSKTECDSHVDRHENIGKGTIPLKVLKLFVHDPRLVHAPKILETPEQNGHLGYKDEMDLLR